MKYIIYNWTRGGSFLPVSSLRQPSFSEANYPTPIGIRLINKLLPSRRVCIYRSYVRFAIYRYRYMRQSRYICRHRYSYRYRYRYVGISRLQLPTSHLPFSPLDDARIHLLTSSLQREALPNYTPFSLLRPSRFIPLRRIDRFKDADDPRPEYRKPNGLRTKAFQWLSPSSSHFYLYIFRFTLQCTLRIYLLLIQYIIIIKYI